MRTYLPAYQGRYFPGEIPALELKRGDFPENPDPLIFKSAGRRWVSRSPGGFYTWSSSADAWLLKSQLTESTLSGPPELEPVAGRPGIFRRKDQADELGKISRRASARYLPGLERDISRLERRIRSGGLRKLPEILLRGISTSADASDGPTVEMWRARGYISERGGNYFLTTRKDTDLPPDVYLARLFASVASTVQYGERGEVPAVVLARLSRGFRPPVNRGVDGIDGTYPYSLDTTEGERRLLRNFDVGHMTRRGFLRGEGDFRGNGIPDRNVLRVIGGRELPARLRSTSPSYAQPTDLRIARARYFYREVLKELVDELDP